MNWSRDQIKELIEEADARRVSRVVLSEFEPLLNNGNGNSHTNGKNGNGYALVGEASDGSDGTPSIESPVTNPASPPILPFTGSEVHDLDQPENGPSLL
jgi:hypothetical protein